MQGCWDWSSPWGLQPHLSPQRQKCAAQSWPSTADNYENLGGISSHSQNHARSTVLQDLKTIHSGPSQGSWCLTPICLVRKQISDFLCGQSVFSRMVTIGFNNTINFRTLSAQAQLYTVFFFCYVLLFFFISSKIVIALASRIAVTAWLCDCTQNPAAHWTSPTRRSRRRSKQRNKRPKPSPFPSGGAAPALTALHNSGSCSSAEGTSGQTAAGASLTAEKLCLKKPHFCLSVCKGCEAAGQEADNTCQSNPNHLGGIEACAPTAPAPGAPRGPTMAPTLLPHQETCWYPSKGGCKSWALSWENKKWQRFFICRTVFSSTHNVAKSSFVLLQLVTHMQCLFLKLHRKDLRTRCINMHVRT